jgi:hypothetical protein
MVGGEVLSNDGLRLELRRRICGANQNCTPYRRWRETAIRAARIQ